MGRKFTENNIHFSLFDFFPTQTDGERCWRGAQVTALQQLLSLQENDSIDF